MYKQTYKKMDDKKQNATLIPPPPFRLTFQAGDKKLWKFELQ